MYAFQIVWFNLPGNIDKNPEVRSHLLYLFFPSTLRLDQEPPWLMLPTPLSSSRSSSSRSLAAPSGSSASSSPSYSHRTRKLGTRPARRQHTNLIHRLLPLYVQKCQRCQIFQLVLFLTNNLFTNLISVYQT